jgi:two-component system CheB/CheR fusion protein
LTPLDGAAGPGFAKIARDMTGTKRQELAQEYRISREKKASLTAQMANELKDRFLAVMSHELKQPLNLIQMNVELLARLPAASEHPKVRQIGETIKRAVTSQTQIINDLLDLSRIRTGKLRLNRVAVDVSELVQSLANAATADVPKKQFDLEVKCAPNISCVGDRIRIEQIVWNLLNNAIKFTPDGGRIAVAVDKEGDQARITVSDSGCGIAPENLSHVFGMFNQGDTDATARNGGLGIGLALVQELALAHGGRVEAESEGVGKGSKFSVWLPLHGSVVPRVAPIASTIDVDFNNLRVLAVDDHMESLLPFAEVLRLEGAVVDVAESARAGLQLLEEKPYDLLISDLGMPEMDGYEFIAEIRRRPATRKLVALAMSGFGRRADARRALEAGFDAHVPKPAGIEDLKAVLQKL